MVIDINDPKIERNYLFFYTFLLWNFKCLDLLTEGFLVLGLEVSDSSSTGNLGGEVVGQHYPKMISKFPLCLYTKNVYV